MDGRWLQLVSGLPRAGISRTGYVVGKQALRRAVDRNRLRRILRETVRLARPSLVGCDFILRLKRPCTRADEPAIRTEAARLLASLARTTPVALQQ